MEPKVIENKKNLLKVSFKEIDRGFMTLIQDKLWESKATEIAGFNVTHPEAGELIFTLRTKGADAKKVWNSALASLLKDLKNFETETKKIK